MGAKHDLKIGDKIDLCLGKPPYFRTQIEDMTGDDRIIAAIPTYRGVTVIMRREQELQLYYYRETGRMCVDVRVNQFYLIGNLKTVELEIISPPRKEQRRIAFRVPVKIEAVAYFPPDGSDEADAQLLLGGETETTYTKNISESGVALILKRPCELGEKILLDIHLPKSPGHETVLQVLAEARQKEYDHIKEIYRIGFQFLNIDEKSRAILAKYIFRQQLKQLKQERLIEGE